MANISIPHNNMTAGEIDPILLGRTDLPVVAMGCMTLLNAIPLKSGGVRRIPGSYFAGYAYNSGALKGRLIPFNAKSGRYMVEFTDLKARIWNSTHTVVQYSSADLVLTTTITQAELPEFHAKVINNELWIVHHNHKPQKIAESTPAPFAISEPTFTGIRTFAATGDYPSTVTAYRGSLVFGATDNEPAAYLLSRSPVAATGVYRLTDFTTGSNPDDAIFGVNTDGLGSRIQWLQARRRMAAGMTASIYAEVGTGLPTTANFYMDSIGDTGSAPAQAAILGDALLYIGAPIPSLQMIGFSQEAGGAFDAELSRTCQHLLYPGVLEISTMKTPTPMAWLTRTDGKMAVISADVSGGSITVGGALYQPADGGLIQSAAVMRGGAADELWTCVKRGNKYCIEWLTFPTDRDADFTELHYIDAGIRWTGASTKTVSGLAHLEGKTVHAIADGQSMPAAVVASGAVTYTKSFTKIHIGLPNESLCTPTRPEVQANMTWQGKKKNVEAVTLRIHNSYGGKVAAGKDPEPGDYQTIPYTGGPFQAFGAAPSPVTADIPLDMGGMVDTDGVVTIKQDEPFPMTLLAVISRIKIQEA